ncbi:ABC transport system ATP-binding protein [Thermoplasma volcanium GSS1]|uniref:ABC transport system ATP-binding protein n=1 Tax=Thermoplasma volcanium (strain ATCC 51530 / DSM 4299 / JCM 9571 / NBRC 15438 / GSS1) TaxID=273116 RepID=Q978M3_THEVO|nr:ABC transporter ATP-binding protein [Thermoplasma volcanium]BAB60534.1 ABC transport system ATP-binding protein [Thermoplasma volcanium GSS1]
MAEDIIEVEHFKQTYDGKKFVVDDVSFHVKRGEIYGLLGKNGAGKTTTIRTLTTIMPVHYGKVKVLGLDVSTHPEKIRQRIGVVLQSESFDFTTVEKNLKIYGMLWDVPGEVLKARIEEVMEVFDLSRLRKIRALELSGGQKKRLQVAREFLHDMDLLFLDEPTVGLDPIMRRTVLNYIKEKAKAGLTVLYTTQIMEEADYLCDRIAIMNNGKIVAEGTSDFLKSKYGDLKTIKIHISGNVNREDLKMMFPEFVQIEGDEVRLISKNVEDVLPDMILYFKRSGIHIERINVEETSLDDVFLRVVS